MAKFNLVAYKDFSVLTTELQNELRKNDLISFRSTDQMFQDFLFQFNITKNQNFEEINYNCNTDEMVNNIGVMIRRKLISMEDVSKIELKLFNYYGECTSYKFDEKGRLIIEDDKTTNPSIIGFFSANVTADGKLIKY